MKMKSPPRTRILLVEDHQIVRQGLARLINMESDLKVCGEASNASEALAQISRLKPDLVLTDISMSGMNGIEFLKHLKTQHPGMRAVVLSMHDEAHYAERAFRAGALAFVMKKESTDELLTALRKAHSGEHHVSEKLGRRIFQLFLQSKKPPEASVSLLSDRELEVFELLGRGRGSKEIAAELHVSVKTVDTHRTHIKEKLNLHSFTELIQRAVQWLEREETGNASM